MSQRKIKTKENLETARSLIDKPQKWERAWGTGSRISFRYSFYDAIYWATQISPPPTPEFRMLGRALGGAYSVDRLLGFERDHSHKELMKLFDDAIEMCDK